MTQNVKMWIIGLIALMVLVLMLMLGVLAVNSGDLNFGADAGGTSMMIAGINDGGSNGG